MAERESLAVGLVFLLVPAGAHATSSAATVPLETKAVETPADAYRRFQTLKGEDLAEALRSKLTDPSGAGGARWLGTMLGDVTARLHGGSARPEDRLFLAEFQRSMGGILEANPDLLSPELKELVLKLEAGLEADKARATAPGGAPGGDAPAGGARPAPKVLKKADLNAAQTSVKATSALRPGGTGLDAFTRAADGSRDIPAADVGGPRTAAPGGAPGPAGEARPPAARAGLPSSRATDQDSARAMAARTLPQAEGRSAGRSAADLAASALAQLSGLPLGEPLRLAFAAARAAYFPPEAALKARTADAPSARYARLLTAENSLAEGALAKIRPDGKRAARVGADLDYLSARLAAGDNFGDALDSLRRKDAQAHAAGLREPLLAFLAERDRRAGKALAPGLEAERKALAFAFDDLAAGRSDYGAFQAAATRAVRTRMLRDLGLPEERLKALGDAEFAALQWDEESLRRLGVDVEKRVRWAGLTREKLERMDLSPDRPPAGGLEGSLSSLLERVEAGLRHEDRILASAPPRKGDDEAADIAAYAAGKLDYSALRAKADGDGLRAALKAAGVAPAPGREAGPDSGSSWRRRLAAAGVTEASLAARGLTFADLNAFDPGLPEAPLAREWERLGTDAGAVDPRALDALLKGFDSLDGGGRAPAFVNGRTFSRYEEQDAAGRARTLAALGISGTPKTRGEFLDAARAAGHKVFRIEDYYPEAASWQDGPRSPPELKERIDAHLAAREGRGEDSNPYNVPFDPDAFYDPSERNDSNFPDRVGFLGLMRERAAQAGGVLSLGEVMEEWARRVPPPGVKLPARFAELASFQDAAERRLVADFSGRLESTRPERDLAATAGTAAPADLGAVLGRRRSLLESAGFLTGRDADASRGLVLGLTRYAALRDAVGRAVLSDAAGLLADGVALTPRRVGLEGRVASVDFVPKGLDGRAGVALLVPLGGGLTLEQRRFGDDQELVYSRDGRPKAEVVLRGVADPSLSRGLVASLAEGGTLTLGGETFTRGRGEDLTLRGEMAMGGGAVFSGTLRLDEDRLGLVPWEGKIQYPPGHPLEYETRRDGAPFNGRWAGEKGKAFEFVPFEAYASREDLAAALAGKDVPKRTLYARKEGGKLTEALEPVPDPSAVGRYLPGQFYDYLTPQGTLAQAPHRLIVHEEALKARKGGLPGLVPEERVVGSHRVEVEVRDPWSRSGPLEANVRFFSREPGQEGRLAWESQFEVAAGRTGSDLDRLASGKATEVRRHFPDHLQTWDFKRDAYSEAYAPTEDFDSSGRLKGHFVYLIDHDNGKRWRKGEAEPLSPNINWVDKVYIPADGSPMQTLFRYRLGNPGKGSVQSQESLRYGTYMDYGGKAPDFAQRDAMLAAVKGWQKSQKDVTYVDMGGMALGKAFEEVGGAFQILVGLSAMAAGSAISQPVPGAGLARQMYGREPMLHETVGDELALTGLQLVAENAITRDVSWLMDHGAGSRESTLGSMRRELYESTMGLKTGPGGLVTVDPKHPQAHVGREYLETWKANHPDLRWTADRVFDPYMAPGIAGRFQGMVDRSKSMHGEAAGVYWWAGQAGLLSNEVGQLAAFSAVTGPGRLALSTARTGLATEGAALLKTGNVLRGRLAQAGAAGLRTGELGITAAEKYYMGSQFYGHMSEELTQIASGRGDWKEHAASLSRSGMAMLLVGVAGGLDAKKIGLGEALGTRRGRAELLGLTGRQAVHEATTLAVVTAARPVLTQFMGEEDASFVATLIASSPGALGRLGAKLPPDGRARLEAAVAGARRQAAAAEPAYAASAVPEAPFGRFDPRSWLPARRKAAADAGQAAERDRWVVAETMLGLHLADPEAAPVRKRLEALVGADGVAAIQESLRSEALAARGPVTAGERAAVKRSYAVRQSLDGETTGIIYGEGLRRENASLFARSALSLHERVHHALGKVGGRGEIAAWEAEAVLYESERLRLAAAGFNPDLTRIDPMRPYRPGGYERRLGEIYEKMERGDGSHIDEISELYDRANARFTDFWTGRSFMMEDPHDARRIHEHHAARETRILEALRLQEAARAKGREVILASLVKDGAGTGPLFESDLAHLRARGIPGAEALEASIAKRRSAAAEAGGKLAGGAGVQGRSASAALEPAAGIPASLGLETVSRGLRRLFSSLPGGARSGVLPEAPARPAPEAEAMAAVPSEFREVLEEFYGETAAQAVPAKLARYPELSESLPALWPDHGKTHGMNVVGNVAAVQEAAQASGLIPAREPGRAEFMLLLGRVNGVMHDMWMKDLSPEGRPQHPNRAAMTAFGPRMDAAADQLLEAKVGGKTFGQMLMKDYGVEKDDVPRVVRELLSMSYGHSKSTLKMDVLNSMQGLRDRMKAVVSKAEPGLELPVDKFYPGEGTFTERAFDWLKEGHPLGEDAVDMVRALRLADAFRWRGSQDLRGSQGSNITPVVIGGEVMVLKRLADPADGRTYNVAFESKFSLGEGNMERTVLARDGSLVIGLERGDWGSAKGDAAAAAGSAVVIVDVYRDFAESFVGADTRALVIERPRGEKPGFSEAVAKEVFALAAKRGPEFEAQMRRALRFAPAPELAADVVKAQASGQAFEHGRYAALPPADIPALAARLKPLAQAGGAEMEKLDMTAALAGAKVFTLEPGELLLARGVQGEYVYIPMEKGLKVFPGKAYPAADLRPGVPVGDLSVLSGGPRNADIEAVGRGVEIVAIPADTYRSEWTKGFYTFPELSARLKKDYPEPQAGRGAEGSYRAP